jgi:Zn-dependent alcohol dehydrogenase
MMARGDLSVKPFVTNPFALKDILKAFDALNREEIVKAILQPNDL